MSDRGEYRPIHTVLPESPEFKALSKDGKLLVYGLKLSLGFSGIGVLYDDQLAERSGLTVEELGPARAELVSKDWLVLEGRIHWLRNGLRFEPTISLDNPNHRKAVVRHLQGLPRLSIVSRFATYYELPAPFGGAPEATANGRHPQGDANGIGMASGGHTRSVETEPETTTTTTTEPEPETRAHARGGGGQIAHAIGTAVGAFCKRTGAKWRLDTAIGAWAEELTREPKYTGLDLPYEIRKCADWHVGNKKRPKAPDMSIRNWLERAEKTPPGAPPGPGDESARDQQRANEARQRQGQREAERREGEERDQLELQESLAWYEALDRETKARVDSVVESRTSNLGRLPATVRRGILLGVINEFREDGASRRASA